MYRFKIKCDSKHVYSEVLIKLSNKGAYLLGGGINNDKYLAVFKIDSEKMTDIIKDEEISKYVFL